MRYLPSMTVMMSFIWMCSLSGSSKSCRALMSVGWACRDGGVSAWEHLHVPLHSALQRGNEDHLKPSIPHLPPPGSHAGPRKWAGPQACGPSTAA